MKLSGWGKFPVIDATVHAPKTLESLRDLIAENPSVIARGSGLAYGDSAINRAATIEMKHLNRMLEFDPERGQLTAEAGVLLGDIISVFLPKGWFPLVTPGTKYVTLGGAIAADVHGKNHHKVGSFRTCVDWIEVMGSNGEVSRCEPGLNSELFEYTLGGMGLTGVILRAAIRLQPVETAWIRQVTKPAYNLKEAMDIFETEKDATYSVAWIDCLAHGASLGRSLIMLGEHAATSDLSPAHACEPYLIPIKRKLTIPFDFPKFTLNSFTVRNFNWFYYRSGTKRTNPQLVDWDSYFYPLDAIRSWNRVYGRHGFAQFQCVFPLATSKAGLTALLQAIEIAGEGSFLAVLKRFGPQSSRFSFPMEGYTLALDFPVTRKSLLLLEDLDRITVTYGGRFYLAKDSRMSAKTLRESDSRTENFEKMREAEGWFGRFSSAQAERLSI